MSKELQIILKSKKEVEDLKVKISLEKVDDNFFTKERVEIDKGFNKKSEKIKIQKGKYLFKIEIEFKKRILKLIPKKIRLKSEKVINIKKNTSLTFDLDNFKEEVVSEKEIERIYEEERSDKERCYKCKKLFKSYSDKYTCRYCKRNFCSNHRLPEEHNCKGNPSNPFGLKFGILKK